MNEKSSSEAQPENEKRASGETLEQRKSSQVAKEQKEKMQYEDGYGYDDDEKPTATTKKKRAPFISLLRRTKISKAALTCQRRKRRLDPSILKQENRQTSLYS
jgi:hypothetical protein